MDAASPTVSGPLPCWLLLRGLGRQAGHWAEFPEVLEASGARVFRLDLPGMGRARDEAAPWSVGGIASSLRRRFLELPGAGEEPWGLLGVSLGAMTAMAWASRHPRDFARVIAVNGSAGQYGAPWERLTPLAWRTIARLLRTPDPLERERILLPAISNARGSDSALQERFAEVERRIPLSPAAFRRQFVAGAGFFCPRRLPPSLRIVVGAGDRFVAPACSRRLARGRKMQLWEHPWAGHELDLDDPRWLAAVAQDLEAEPAPRPDSRTT